MWHRMRPRSSWSGSGARCPHCRLPSMRRRNQSSKSIGSGVNEGERKKQIVRQRRAQQSLVVKAKERLAEHATHTHSSHVEASKRATRYTVGKVHNSDPCL